MVETFKTLCSRDDAVCASRWRTDIHFPSASCIRVNSEFLSRLCRIYQEKRSHEQIPEIRQSIIQSTMTCSHHWRRIEISEPQSSPEWLLQSKGGLKPWQQNVVIDAVVTGESSSGYQLRSVNPTSASVRQSHSTGGECSRLKISVNALTLLSPGHFKSLRNRYHNLILTSKKQYYSNLIFAVSDNPRRLWQTVNMLLCRKTASPLPTSTSFTSLADSFVFFLYWLRLSLGVFSTTTFPHSHAPLTTPPSFSTFKPATKSEISKMLSTFLTNNLILIVSQPGLLINVLQSLFPLSLTYIDNNLSLSSGQFHPSLKQSTISSLLKKPNLDKDQLSNYHPVYNLSLVSKIIERVVKSQLTEHLISNNLLNPHQ